MTNPLDACILAQPVDCGGRVAKHDLVTMSVNSFPDTKLTDDRNVLSSCLLDKRVVEQLATRIIDVVPSALIVWRKVSWALCAPACRCESHARLQRGDRVAER